jgi:type IV secretion system protein VirD4
MAAISLGLEWDATAGTTGKRVIYDQNRHLICFGPTRSGKGVSLEIPNLLRMGNRREGGEPISIISIDPKGQNAAVTARYRKKISDLVFINPQNLLGLGSSGFNPLARLDPASPQFFVHASNIAEALVPLSKKSDPFFDGSARDLMLGLVMWEVAKARAEKRMPLLKHVRGTLTGGLVEVAEQALAGRNFQIASLLGQFREVNRTTSGIISSAARATSWLLDDAMLADLSKDGIDFARLKGPRPVTCYVMLPPETLETFSPWLRMVAAAAFNALYRQGGGGLRTLFLMSEFAQLGTLSMVNAALAQGAGYGIQLFCVLQDLNQLQVLYGEKEANTFLGMSGATFAFTPNDPTTAEWMSKRSSSAIMPTLSTSDDPQTGEPRQSWRGERRRFYEPDELYNIPEFHGFVWFAGQSTAQPVYAPPYWDRENADIKGRFDRDPYHQPAKRGWFG